MKHYQFISLTEPVVPPAEPPPGPPRRSAPGPSTQEATDVRYLEKLGGEVRELVEQDEAIRRIITRELVRDVDRRVLNLEKLLRDSTLRVHVEIDSDGQLSDRGIDQSPGVPSIDHLVLELLRLSGEYGLLQPLKDVQRLSVTIHAADTIDIEVRADARDPAKVPEIAKLAQTLLTLARFALVKEALFLVENISVEISEEGIRLTRSYDKDFLVQFLQQYLSGTLPAPSPGTALRREPPPSR